MNEKDKRKVLESILKSTKINTHYEKYKSKYKLNKPLIVERIMNEIDGLWERFRDIGKLQRFLESFISNHIRDFLLTRQKDKTESIDRSNDVEPKSSGDTRVEQDPQERLKKEIEERKKSNIIIKDISTIEEEHEESENTNNEENIEEKNDTSNSESTDMNRNSHMNSRLNPTVSPHMTPNMNNPHPPPNMNNNPYMNPYTPPNMNNPHMNSNLNPTIHPNMNPNMKPNMPPQMNNGNMYPNMPPNQNMPPNGNMYPNMPPNGNMYPNMPPNGNIPPNMYYQGNNMHTDNTSIPQPNKMVSAKPTEHIVAEIKPIEDIDIQPERSVIHIDSIERNLNDSKRCNPFNIYMNDNTTCLVCIRDIIISNIHNDPYLLVQVSEYKNSVYENQLNRDIHFKMVRTNKDQNVSYYKNTDNETMIRLRDIDRVTFNIIRPNGKLLYSYLDDILDINILNDKEKQTYLETMVVVTNPDDPNIEILETNTTNITEGDVLTLFDNEVSSGNETRVLYVDKKENKVVLEYLERTMNTFYKKALINKFQISISLEII